MPWIAWGRGVSGPARGLLRAWLDRYAADAAALPLDRLRPLIDRHGPDPSALSAALGADPARVMRRLAAMPPEVLSTPVGTGGRPARDRVGGLRRRRSPDPSKGLPDFSLPLTAPGCPLVMPLYEALSRPGHPIRSVIAMPGGSAPRLTAYAFAMFDLSLPRSMSRT